MEKTGYSVIAGRPAARRFEETHRTAPQVSFATILEVLGAITFAVVLLALYGCSDEYERLQSEADWNAKVARACLPSKTETLVNIRHLGDGYIVRRYSPYGSKQPYLSTDVLARSE